MGRANASWAGTHPCYRLGQGGYQCECGHVSGKKGDHNKHVVEHNDKDLASRNMSWQDYNKHFDREQWEKDCAERKARREAIKNLTPAERFLYRTLKILPRK